MTRGVSEKIAILVKKVAFLRSWLNVTRNIEGYNLSLFKNELTVR
jgi:hypothetical protein